MTDDNIIGIDGRQAVELRTDQAEREQREEILRQKLKCEGLELRPGMAPGTYTIAHPQPPQPPYLKGWRDLSLEQVEDATSDIDVGQDPRFGCGTLRAVRFWQALESRASRILRRAPRRIEALLLRTLQHASGSSEYPRRIV